MTLSLGDDRERTLAEATRLVEQAWQDFDTSRDVETLPSPALIKALHEPLPWQGADPVAQLDLAAQVLDASLAQSRPRYLAYIGSSGLEIGALADLLAHSYDINMALDARGASLVEQQAIHWVAEFLGFPASIGSFTSGGTISNITALAAARERALPGAREHGLAAMAPAALYCSVEAHYSVTRAAELLGFGRTSVRAIPIDASRRMDPAALERAIEADIAAGIVPVAVVATAGTTLTGAVDPLRELAQVCTTHAVWLHVDGAYGLPAAATTAAGPLFDGLDLADSISVDAHKWMFVPKACSAILVRDTAALARTFSHDEAYIPHAEDNSLNAVDITLEYSRPLRALKLWLAMRVHGADAFREAISGNLLQAQTLYDEATAHPRFRVMERRPQLSIVPVQHIQPGCTDRSAHNAALCQAIQDDGRVYISPATIDGEVWLRPCFTNFRTTLDDVAVTLAVADEIGQRICAVHEG